MTVNERKLSILALAGIILLGMFLLIAAGKLFVAPIGPGIPPPEYLPGLMIHWNGDDTVCAGDDYQGEIVTFIPEGKAVNENYGQFPQLSRFGSYQLFRDGKTNTTLIIAVWYFEIEADFTTAQQTLLAFLRQNGTLHSYELAFGESSNVCNASMNSSFDEEFYAMRKIHATSFEGRAGSGIFLTNSRPLMPGRDDYFIQYIGVMNTTAPSRNTHEIRNLIAAASLNQPYFLNGEIDELSGVPGTGA